jgi:diaminopimelate decarboxylase
MVWSGPRGGGSLTEVDGTLHLDGVSLAEVAARHGTPTYVYGRSSLARRFAELREALGGLGRPFRIRFAMKSNRHPEVLAAALGEGDVDLDTCSPREVLRGLEAGFPRERISLTAGMLSNRDLLRIAEAGVVPNLDTFSVIRRWAETPGRKTDAIGLRLNPGVKVGWGGSPKLAYGDAKFGFDRERVVDAAREARARGLVVEELHVHLGWGMQASDAAAAEVGYARLAEACRAVGGVRRVNVGGGLCWPQRDEDAPLSLGAWVGAIRRALAGLPPEVEVICEPGTWITAAAGVLLVEVTTVEARAKATWVGVDAGHAVNLYAAHYGIPLFFIPVRDPRRPIPGALESAPRRVNIGGNINEANDVFALELPFPEVAEGEVLALWPAGAYGASMASDHCLRGQPAEVVVG